MRTILIVAITVLLSGCATGFGGASGADIGEGVIDALAAKAPSHRSIWPKVGLAASGFCGAGDLATTLYYRGAGKVTEVNPLLASVQDFPIAFTVRKFSMEASVFSGALILDKIDHPKLSSLMSFGNAALKCALMFHNDQIGRRP